VIRKSPTLVILQVEGVVGTVITSAAHRDSDVTLIRKGWIMKCKVQRTLQVALRMHANRRCRRSASRPHGRVVVAVVLPFSMQVMAKQIQSGSEDRDAQARLFALSSNQPSKVGLNATQRCPELGPVAPLAIKEWHRAPRFLSTLFTTFTN
jgi:hypothetical protein